VKPRTEAGGHHPDDRPRHPVDPQGPPEDLAVAAEAALPEFVAEDRHRLGAGELLRLGEAPSEDRRHPQERQHRGGDRGRVQPLGSLAAGQVDGPAVVDPQVLEDPVRPPVEEIGGVGVLELGNAEPRGGVPHPHQPLRVGVGQRPQQDAVDDAEDRGVGADAEGQGEDREQGESRLPQELADGGAEVAEERIHRQAPVVRR
jgi:hypothetical protein